ncbi:MAG: hypothetical protein O3B01_13355 [Planctomycetota bacterium]|nr:hypothetical protein [Planctomycetota bacterium]MDA1139560.1 hypothetical protein [Planctomycetota bacterium]
MRNAFSQLLSELEGISTSDIPLIEWHHKLCFLAVVMDEKPAFAIGFDEPVPPRLVHFLDQQSPLLGLKVFSTKRPPREYLKMADVPPAIALAIVDKWDRSNRTNHSVTWVVKREDCKEAVERAVKGEARLGDALGYPACCAEAYNADRALHLQMYYQALCKSEGSNSTSVILKALEKNESVKAELPSAQRVIRTMSRFSFLPFIACQSCLDSPESPCSKRNETYRRVLATLAPGAARRVLIMARAMSNYGGGTK